MRVGYFPWSNFRWQMYSLLRCWVDGCLHWIEWELNGMTNLLIITTKAVCHTKSKCCTKETPIQHICTHRYALSVGTAIYWYYQKTHINLNVSQLHAWSYTQLHKFHQFTTKSCGMLYSPCANCSRNPVVLHYLFCSLKLLHITR